MRKYNLFEALSNNWRITRIDTKELDIARQQYSSTDYVNIHISLESGLLEKATACVRLYARDDFTTFLKRTHSECMSATRKDVKPISTVKRIKQQPFF